MIGRSTSVVFLVFLLAASTASDVLAQRLRRTVVVSPVPGNAVRSGNRLVRALTRPRILAASATDPWLVKVEPGVYDVDGATVAMVPFVDVEGSGQDVTRITGVASGAATVMGAAHAELRELTVENRGSGGFAIRNDGESFRAHEVTVLASGGATAGLINNGRSSEFSFVTARVDAPTGGTGISNNADSTIWKCIRSTISGEGILYAFFNRGDGEFTDLVVEAKSTSFAGGIRNEGPSDPVLRNVRATARSEGVGQAITNGGSSNARLYDVVAFGEGGDFGVGVSNQSGRPTLKNVEAVAEGGSSAFGVANLYGADVVMTDVTAIARGGPNGAALLSDGSRSTVHNATLLGDGFAVDNRFDPASVALIGASKLEGPVNAGPGILRCVSSYDATLTPLDAACLP